MNDLAAFSYVNDGLFADKNIEIPRFTEKIVDLIVKKASAGFDWSEISPTISGAVFESTLNPETRRSGGMHYFLKAVELTLNKGLEATINRKKRETPPVPAKVTGDIEAHIIALACGEPPEGYSRWSVRLIAQKCVELNYIDSISHMTVSRILKKTNLSLT